MSDINGVKVYKKRGRKPKNKIPDSVQIIEEPIDSDKEVIIAYLPINLNDMEEKEITINYLPHIVNDIDIFIKSESQINDISSENYLNDKLDLSLIHI
jgi:hypothetical protein